MTSQYSVTRSGQMARAVMRHKLFEPVVLRRKGVSLRAHLLDVSVSGALVHANEPPLPSEQVEVETDGLAVTANVVWVRDKRFGLRFDHQLSEIVVQQLIQR